MVMCVLQKNSGPGDTNWGEEEDKPEGVEEAAPALGPQDVEAQLHVKDAGMMLVSTVAPDFTWQSGNADIAIRSPSILDSTGKARVV